MSVLSMVAFRMVTQEGLQKCLNIYEELNRNGESAEEKTATPLAAPTTTATTVLDMHDAKSSSRSAKRRIRRKKLKESRRCEEITAMKKAGKEMEDETEENERSTKKSSRANENVVDVAPYNLVTHSDRRASKGFLERTLMAAFLLKCLQRVGFFARSTADDGTILIIGVSNR